MRIRQWPDEEFAPIAAAIDRLMEGAGLSKAKGADDGVDSDYSGRRLGRPTHEEIASSRSTVPPEDAIVTTLPDGREAVQGYDEDGDTHAWYLPNAEGGRTTTSPWIPRQESRHDGGL